MSRIISFKMLLVLSVLCNARWQASAAVISIEPRFGGSFLLGEKGLYHHGMALKLQTEFQPTPTLKLAPVLEGAYTHLNDHLEQASQQTMMTYEMRSLLGGIRLLYPLASSSNYAFIGAYHGRGQGQLALRQGTAASFQAATAKDLPTTIAAAEAGVIFASTGGISYLLALEGQQIFIDQRRASGDVNRKTSTSRGIEITNTNLTGPEGQPQLENVKFYRTLDVKLGLQLTF